MRGRDSRREGGREAERKAGRGGGAAGEGGRDEESLERRRRVEYYLITGGGVSGDVTTVRLPPVTVQKTRATSKRNRRHGCYSQRTLSARVDLTFAVGQ